MLYTLFLVFVPPLEPGQNPSLKPDQKPGQKSDQKSGQKSRGGGLFTGGEGHTSRT